MGFFAADSRGSAGINGKFKVEDWFLDAGFVEAVLVAFDDGND